MEGYTVMTIEYRLNLDDTNKHISNTEFVRNWRQGSGYIIDPINTTFDDLNQTLVTWNEHPTIFQLMGSAKACIVKRSKITSQSYPNVIGHDNHNTPILQIIIINLITPIINPQILNNNVLLC